MTRISIILAVIGTPAASALAQSPPCRVLDKASLLAEFTSCASRGLPQECITPANIQDLICSIPSLVASEGSQTLTSPNLVGGAHLSGELSRGTLAPDTAVEIPYGGTGNTTASRARASLRAAPLDSPSFTGNAQVAGSLSIGGALNAASLTSPLISGISTVSIQDNPPFPGGNNGSNVAIFPSGSVVVHNDFPTSYGNSAAGLCVFAGDAYPATNGECTVLGSFPNDPTAAAWYPIGDTAGSVVVMTGAPAWLQNVAGTFTATRFNPLTPLTLAQLSRLRYGQVLDTNDSPKCSGLITGWDQTGGSYITVAGWYQQGHALGSGPSCTPSNSSNFATVRFSKLYGFNTFVNRRAVDQQNETVGYEVDVINNSGVDDTCFGYDILCPEPQTPSDGGVDAISLGSNRASFAYQARGRFVSQGVFTGDSTWGLLVSPINGENVLYGFDAHPWGGGSMGIGFSAAGATEAWRNWDATGNIKGRLFGNGNLSLGSENVAQSFFNRIYSSGHGEASPDAQWFYGNGTGNLDGVVTISSGQFNIQGTVYNPPKTWADSQTCAAGQIAWDDNYIYVCTATNTVKRALLSPF